MIHITVHLFAGAAELAGCREVALALSDDRPPTVASVKAELVLRHPGLESVLTRAWCARNDDYVTNEARVDDGDRIAVIPPVSGGQQDVQSDNEDIPDIAILRAPLSVETMHTRMIDHKAGAVVVFAGTVREFTKGRQTRYLQYEAYDRMALAKLAEVKEECTATWPILKMAIWHRVGDLQLTETSVLIGVATPHRHDAFAAAEHAIVRLKQIVPIWKKEFYADGAAEWVGPDGPWKPIADRNS